MSNVIDFARATAMRRRSRDAIVRERLSDLALTETTVASTMLLEGLDDPQLALAKATFVVACMPNGPARDLAEHDLRRLRTRLAGAQKTSADDPGAA